MRRANGLPMQMTPTTEEAAFGHGGPGHDQRRRPLWARVPEGVAIGVVWTVVVLWCAGVALWRVVWMGRRP